MLQKEHEDDGFLAGRDPGGWKGRIMEQAERSQYFFRLENEGYLENGVESLDNWHLRSEYWNYRHWAESIKFQAMDTLRFTVSRLLNDFEDNDDVGNSVSGFE
jgi:hypothetical protein